MKIIPAIRLLGSNTSIFSNKSSAPGEVLGNRAENCCLGYCGSCLTYLRALLLLKNPRLASSGEPISCCITKGMPQAIVNKSKLHMLMRRWKKKMRITNDILLILWVWSLKFSILSIYLCDKSQLMNIIFAGKQRPPCNNFTKYATYRPDINRSGVFWTIQEQFWCPVPPSDNIFSHEIGLRCCPRKPKVSNFQITVCIEKQVARFQIPMQDIGRMDIL